LQSGRSAGSAGKLDVVGDGEVVEQVEELEDDADLLAAEPGQTALAQLVDPVTEPRSACPARRRFSSVDLPLPEGPVTARASPWATLRSIGPSAGAPALS
jgi:hypothetical protein